MSLLRRLFDGEPTDYTEVVPTRGEQPEDYAKRLLTELLPTFRNRDDAMRALYLCYPYARPDNFRLKIAAAIYFAVRTEPERRA